MSTGEKRRNKAQDTSPLTMSEENILEVKGLKTHFYTEEGVVPAVDGVDFTIPKGKIVAVVGESGSGKSVSARSVLGLIDKPGRVVDGSILWRRDDGRVIDIAQLPEHGDEVRRLRGSEISMIFQEPMASMSPVLKVEKQMTSMIQLHLGLDKDAARERAIDMLRRVDMPKAESRLDSYTFELSGGMCQRVMIAMAISCDPKLLIADEPTTALDVTTQATIIDLIMDLQEQMGLSVVFITHDLGVVAEIADEVVVMYLGKVVERTDVNTLFDDPKHPYTRALLSSIPRLGLEKRHRLAAIRGMVPDPL
jgi:ABC-type dipeptide/oligopeptide/nickel transport system ATPase component